MSGFTMDAVMKAVERYRVTNLFCVPPVMIALAKQGMAGKYDLSSLKYIGSGAAPLGKDVMEVVAKNFPKAEIVQVTLIRQLRRTTLPSEIAITFQSLFSCAYVGTGSSFSCPMA
jgi:acyl-CoA synthetase (AMP-forming)/AMP-acid ligase II